jgi:hypothetical protein
MPEVDLGAARDGPGTHALVVGVSHYRYLSGPEASPFGQQFGLEDLSSAARSASEVVAWLLNEYHNPAAPLASLRVALSPADGETYASGVKERLPQSHAATRDNVERDLIALRNACARPDNVCFVYVAGHGIQLTIRGAIVLLEDFADPQRVNLYGAMDMVGCHDGLFGTGYANNQFWFVDACRQLPRVASKFDNLAGGVLNLPAPLGKVDCAPLILASASRDLAFAEVGGLTLFSQVMLSALRGAAAVGPEDERKIGWHVSAHRLGMFLKEGVAELAKTKSEDQSVEPVGWPGEAIIQHLEEPPSVRVVLTLKPPGAADRTSVSMLFDADEDQEVIKDVAEWPLERTVPAGLYQIRYKTGQPVTEVKLKPSDINPPKYERLIEVPE